MMDTVRLGRTGLQVSVAGLGTGGHSRLGLRQGASFEHSVALVRAALDRGVTLIDTAAAYGTEEIVGAALRGRRDGVVLSTKAQVHKDGSDPAGIELIDGPELARRVDASLARLAVDQIDIMHLHAVGAHQYDHCRRELVPALLRLREAGKIRFLGLTERFASETDHVMLERALEDDVWDVLMVGYNLLNQTAASRVLPAARERDLAVLCMFAVREALISREAASLALERLVASGEVDAAEIEAADPLGFLLAEGVAESLPEAAYRFCRHSPGVSVVLTGTGSSHHLAENLRSITAPPLPPAIVDRLRHIFRHATSASGQLERRQP